MDTLQLNDDQQAMLDGERGTAKQMAMRLVLDLAAAAGATELIPISTAHLSGVSPLTGGLGLRQFLAKLADDPDARVEIPTTLNSAGCDMTQFEQMRIVVPDFLAHNAEIVAQYTRLGVRPTQSCIPYEWEDVVKTGNAAWAESNAICFGNSYCDLKTNRESGLSALAAALTGYAPRYGLLEAGGDKPNIKVMVSAELTDPTDFSILGDWIGKQKQRGWHLPLGPIPAIGGLPQALSHEQRKALTAAAANYGSPKVVIVEDDLFPEGDYQGELLFDEAALAARYAALAPTRQPSLIVIGCPQASVGEMRAVAEYVRGKRVAADPAVEQSADPAVAGADLPPLWVFTSSANKALAQQLGIAAIIEGAGALLLADSCPEVVPYDQSWVKSILTNSMKAEHYIQSGLNGIPTAVMALGDCIAVATGERRIATTPVLAAEDAPDITPAVATQAELAQKAIVTGAFAAEGEGLPSQLIFEVEGEAFVTDTPITLLGFVNRLTGAIEEAGHPANGETLAGKIAIFPKGSGSSVAPYVLLELHYRGMGPLAVINTHIDQHSAPACSLESVPYAYSFDQDVIANINHGDRVRLSRRGGRVTIEVVARK